MKSVKSLLVLLAVTIVFVSCKKTINCDTPILKKVFFFTNVSTYVVPDTAAMVVKYRKGSAFVDVSEIFPRVYLMKVDQNKSMEFPLKGKETYDYDWEITLLPSNRQYRLSKIEHGSATSKTHHCTNEVSYTMNIKYLTTDSTFEVTVPGNPYSTTPYFSADIQVEYY